MAPSAPRRLHLSAIGDAVVSTADGISAIHSAGIPWYLSIPLVAVAVNFTFRLPIQHYARRLVVRRAELTPLVSAWSARHATSLSLSRASAPAQAKAADAGRLWRLRLAGLTEKSRRRIYKTWGVQRWKSLAPLTSMVPFVVVSEALRRLCGAPTGWLSHRIGLASVADDAVLGATLSDTSGLFDAQLAHGGCLWFVDLTAMDPYYLLPLTCSALLARTSWGRLSKDQLGALLSLDGPLSSSSSSSSSSSAGTTGIIPPMARIQKSIGRVLLLMPLFPILFADLPSAIFLYWATTFALNDVNESILHKLVPKRTPALRMVRRVPPALPYLRGGKQ